MLHAKNDSQRIKNELIELKTKNRELFDLIIDLYHYADHNFNKDVVITMIYRTQEEQESIYGSGYSKKSPHQFYHAIDIRSRLYTQDEMNQMVKYLNERYNKNNYYKWTTKVHEVGDHGMHFHIQLVKK